MFVYKRTCKIPYCFLPEVSIQWVNGVRMWGHPNAQAFVASCITLEKSYESTTTCRAKELKAS